ncbi:hypothetical protein ACTG9Q_10035 [Actinokineospora sp. 24-640]
MNGLDQILFGLSREGGIGPLQVSAGMDWPSARMWDARLSRFYRLTPTNHNGDGRPWVPQRALSFLQFSDGKAALIARFGDTDDDPGRNNSHAVLGPAHSLATFAPFVSGWSGWIPVADGRGFHEIDFADWHELRMGALDAARAELAVHQVAVVNMVRAVLADDAAYFAPITRDEPLSLLILAQEILDPVLSTGHSAYDWTFSTYEDSDTTSPASPNVDGSPRFWCLRGTGYGESHRQRVDVGQRLDDDAVTQLAVDLVARYAEDSSTYPTAIRRAVSGLSGRAERIQRLMGSGEPAPVRVKAAVVEEPAQEVRAPKPVQVGVGDGPGLEETLLELERKDLTVGDRRFMVRHLRVLLAQKDPLGYDVRQRLDRFDRRLDAQRGALGVAVAVLFVIALLGWVWRPVPVVTTIRMPGSTVVQVAPETVPTVVPPPR